MATSYGVLLSSYSEATGGLIIRSLDGHDEWQPLDSLEAAMSKGASICQAQPGVDYVIMRSTDGGEWLTHRGHGIREALALNWGR